MKTNPILITLSIFALLSTINAGSSINSNKRLNNHPFLKIANEFSVRSLPNGFAHFNVGFDFVFGIF